MNVKSDLEIQSIPDGEDYQRYDGNYGEAYDYQLEQP